MNSWLFGAVANPWMLEAECRNVDPDIFVPDTEDKKEIAKLESIAKTYCDKCPVRDECLRYAIDTKTKYGVFGGLNPKERKEY